ncbi:hypothetical protein KQ310_02320 [Synechococcus sp. CS-1328]|nr:hypothetical protein [Synechococcus sp. CS-1328]
MGTWCAFRRIGSKSLADNKTFFVSMLGVFTVIFVQQQPASAFIVETYSGEKYDVTIKTVSYNEAPALFAAGQARGSGRMPWWGNESKAKEFDDAIFSATKGKLTANICFAIVTHDKTSLMNCVRSPAIKLSDKLPYYTAVPVR